jgi:hypothetical protein
VFKVSFRVTAVGKSRPPNIIETRVAAAGTLSFTSAPLADQSARADSVSGKVVVEYDVLTPHPRTERLTVTFDTGSFQQNEDGAGKVLSQAVHLAGKVSASSAGAGYLCPVGEESSFVAIRKAGTATYVFSVGGECNLNHGQSAAVSRSSVVHASIHPTCLRTTSGLNGEPLCGGGPPTRITIQVNGAIRGVSLVTGAGTCTGAGFSEGTSCYVYAKPGSTVTATATTDKPLPAGWTWAIVWEPYGGSKTTKCANSPTTCTASIAVPDLGGTIHSHVTTTSGYNDSAMYVVACKTGETPYPGHPCTF